MTEQTTQHAFEDELFFSLRKQRNNWAKVAVGSAATSLVSLAALIVVLPLKESKPFVVMVDKTTGEAEKIVQVRPATLQQQEAVLQAELVSYVTDRETYDPADNRTRIQEVRARSFNNAEQTLVDLWRSDSPQYPPKVYGSDTRVLVKVKSVTPFASDGRNTVDSARVRITKSREEMGRNTVQRSYIVTVGYEFKPQEGTTLEAVWSNPLGFRVLSYRIDAEAAD
ncbi:virB8 family protein [Microvirga tunisiensis]|uniref:Type IV secretion system protein n=1 Tax=Microvirga tunisiensis TaxID=2108360 RepID=A0A5N7MNE5_9HYPH|nr:type IV secretion system protein [Microvirga tunisiensis]MPR10162.1 type IV secretion system protein [Microvirga tunisiensis]MPR28368.1 type IV secretion system protein [Microvirga tunisiensis]